MIYPEQTTSASSLSLKLLGFLALAITIAVVYFSLNPDYPMKQSVTDAPFGDSIIHLFSFGLLMYFSSLFLKQNRIRILLGIGFVLLGVVLEIMQTGEGRVFEFGDAIANTFGVVLGYLATKFHAV